MLSGFKTYLVAIVMAVVSLAAAAGIDIPGFPHDPNWLQHLLDAFGLAALRAGVSSMK